MSLAKRFPLVYRTPYDVLAKRFPLAYRTPYDVLGKALPTCLQDVIRCPWLSASHLSIGRHTMSWQSASHLHIGRHTMSLAKRFPRVYRTAYDALGKALPTCLQDVIRCPWQSASHLSFNFIFPKLVPTLNSEICMCPKQCIII